MKKAILTLGFASLVLSAASFAQCSSCKIYAATNNDLSSGNSSTVFGYPSAGNVVVSQTLTTGGTGIGGGYFANPRITALSNEKCLFVSNAGSETISGFPETSPSPLTYGATPTTVATGGSSATYGVGLAVTPNGKVLFASLDNLQSIASFTVSTTCVLTPGPVTAGIGDYVGPLAVSSDNKVLIATGPNNQFVSAYKIAPSGALSLINTVTLSSVSSCTSTGCYVTGIDISKVAGGNATVVLGNATLSGAYFVSCSLNTTTGLSNCANNGPVTTALANIESPFYDKAAYSTGTGALYLGAAGFGSGYPAGVALNKVTAGVITTAAAATYVNSAAYYASNPQTNSHGATIYVWQSGVSSSANNTMYLYKSNGTNSVAAFKNAANPAAAGSYVLSLTALPTSR